MQFKVIERATGQDVTDHTYWDEFENKYVFDIDKENEDEDYLKNQVLYYINQMGELMSIVHNWVRLMDNSVECIMFFHERIDERDEHTTVAYKMIDDIRRTKGCTLVPLNQNNEEE